MPRLKQKALSKEELEEELYQKKLEMVCQEYGFSSIEEIREAYAQNIAKGVPMGINSWKVEWNKTVAFLNDPKEQERIQASCAAARKRLGIPDDWKSRVVRGKIQGLECKDVIA